MQSDEPVNFRELLEVTHRIIRPRLGELAAFLLPSKSWRMQR